MTFRLLLTLIPFVVLCLQPTYADESKLDERQVKRLKSVIMNPNITLSNRVDALKTLHSDQLVDGKIQRKFCVWDILGRSGPIYAAVEDQRFRAYHYGLDFSLKAYQDETLLIDDLRTGQCDAALITGARAMEFNRFTGTLESLGGVPDSDHLQIIVQLISSPRMVERMQENEYVVLGVATIGENYLYSQTGSAIQLSDLTNLTTGVPSSDASLRALAERYQAKVELGEMLVEVDRFADKKVDALLAPIIGYHIGGASKMKKGMGIVNAPLSLSTLQFIGRADRFPDGLALIFREDFLLKFDNYRERVETERRNIPKERFFDISASEKAQLEEQLTEMRISLREQGIYDSYMLKLLKRVRCHIDVNKAECQDNRE